MLTATVNGTKVLTNAKGFVLYWFAPDTPTSSKCTGSCATYWPPVKGSVTAGSGVTGTLGTITRSDGTTQATYDGHPLYTYAGDTSPGQAKGNGLNVSGGLWYEMTVSGATPAASASAKVRRRRVLTPRSPSRPRHVAGMMTVYDRHREHLLDHGDVTNCLGAINSPDRLASGLP